MRSQGKYFFNNVGRGIPFYIISFLLHMVHDKLAEPAMTPVIFQVFIDKTRGRR